MTSIVANSVLPRRLEHFRDLLRELITRDMKLRYKRSYLGIAWTLVNPLSQLLVFDFVFRVLFRSETPNFTAYLFIGITCWNWFSGALLESTISILNNRDLIRQPGFPAAMLPNVTVGTHLVHFVLTFPILFGLIAYSDLPLTSAVLWLPLVIAVQYVFTLSLALLAASVHVKLRDTQHLLGILLMLGFFLTPILYDISLVPDRYMVYYQLNPMGHFVQAYRSVLLHGEAPDTTVLAILACVATVQLSVFYIMFKRASVDFAEEL